MQNFIKIDTEVTITFSFRDCYFFLSPLVLSRIILISLCVYSGIKQNQNANA